MSWRNDLPANWLNDLRSGAYPGVSNEDDLLV